MPVTYPRLSASLGLTVSLLLATGPFCSAQSAAPEPPTAEVATAVSTSLPDAPEPHNGAAQPPPPPPEKKAETITLAGTPKRILLDQKAIWTSPLHLKPADGLWLLPLAAVTGTMIGSDQHTMNDLIHINLNDQHHFTTVSNASVGTLGALPAGMYLWSLTHYAPQAKETGLLSGEALIDSLAVSEAIQLVTLRDRPNVNNAKGSFFSSSPLDGSFPSNHAVAAWAMASVVGDEYKGWLTRTAVYGLATTVSVSRVLAEQHFPSDVLVGSVAGWLIGHYVYRAHHNFNLNPFDTKPLPRDFGAPPPSCPRIHPQLRSRCHPADRHKSLTPLPSANPPPSPSANQPKPLPEDTDPDTIGSTNVPMDSWIYPALERLAAMGFIPGQSTAIRPWTRQECLRQLRLAEELAGRKDAYSPSLLAQAHLLMTDLHTELESEPQYRASLSLESVYARYGTIAGPALADSFHFGQTWWNDFGRPLGRGSSAIAGFSFRAHDGRFFFYDRQELQHSPGNPAETPARNQLINTLDQIQPDSDPHIRPVPGSAAFNRQGAIELYGGVAFAGNSLSMGKQELYWGPTTMGPLGLLQQCRANLQSASCVDTPSPAALSVVFRNLSLRHRAGKAVRTQLPGAPLVQRSKGRLQLWGQPRDQLYSLVHLLGCRPPHHVPQLQRKRI